MRSSIVVVLLAVAVPGIAKDDGRIEIKSGTNGTTYCTPMDSPACKSHRAVEMQRLNERRDYEQRQRELDRRERELDRRYEIERQYDRR